MDHLKHPHPILHDAPTTSHLPAYTAGLCQRSLTSMFIGHVGLVLVRGSLLLLCSSCSNAPMQLGMEEENNIHSATGIIHAAGDFVLQGTGEEPSTSGNVGEVVDSDSDEEAVAYRQALETKIRCFPDPISSSENQIELLKGKLKKINTESDGFLMQGKGLPVGEGVSLLQGLNLTGPVD